MDFSNVDIPCYSHLWDSHVINVSQIAAENALYECKIHDAKYCPCVSRKMSTVFRDTKQSLELCRPDLQLTKNPLTKKRKKPNSEMCAICLKCINNHNRFLENKYCSHIFHHDCIMKWLEEKDTCPMCRSEFEPKHS